MNYLLQVDFPYEGPFGNAMSTAMQALAEDIAKESGLIWKIWTESEDEHRAGGIYLFDNKPDATRYLEKHTQRLTSFGMEEIRCVIFDINEPLSQIDRAPL